MSDIQPLLDRLRAMYIPASLQLELQPRLSREDAEKIIARITTLERELAEAKATIAVMQKHGVVMRTTPQNATDELPDYVIGTFIDNKGER